MPLQCTEAGLDEAEAECHLELFGHNRLESEEQNPILQVIPLVHVEPLSWVMEAAALVTIILSNGQGKLPYWQDFISIIFLLFVNPGIGFYEERNAGNAIKALMDSLTPKAKVKHGGSWSEIESANLVPGDIVSFKIGDIVPASCHLTEAINISIDQAALILVDPPDDDTTGHLQKILTQIVSLCLIIIGIFFIAYCRGLDNILVHLISGIPIVMHTVLSVTLTVGAQQLVKYKTIVTCITAIKELPGVTTLCSDKTSIITTNKLTIDRSTIKTSLMDFKPFNPINKDTEITYLEAPGKLKRVTGMTGIIIGLCMRNKTDKIESHLEADVEKYASHGLHALAVTFEKVGVTVTGQRVSAGTGAASTPTLHPPPPPSFLISILFSVPVHHV
ncbi:hypothetical protein BDQ17DRAFT_1394247 [Cyathus striatus]|nr:hypothetical protein BDQ17DRAFT_1394247 [Cyathus striatus]